MPEWVVVGLDVGSAWPGSETKVQYRGHDLILYPPAELFVPAVAMSFEPPTTLFQALVTVRQFLSSLSWAEGMSIRETMVTGGGRIARIGRTPSVVRGGSAFKPDYLPEPADPRALLALALYREALTINSVAYQFLGFYKIINIVHQKGLAQKTWINANLDKLTDSHALGRLRLLRAERRDVGKYLYESGRCAVAHAGSEPTVSPEDPEDAIRLSRDLPLVRALAEHLIEHELGVKSKRTVRREHLCRSERALPKFLAGRRVAKGR